MKQKKTLIIESYIKTIVCLLESLYAWSETPWRIKTVFIENAINRLEKLKKIAAAEIEMEESK